MKNLIIKNGLIATAILMGINLLSLVIYGTDAEYFDIGEVIGYSSIVLCLLFVFMGIRESEMLHGNSSFIKRLGVGSAIAFFPSLAFGIYNVIYVTIIDPQFMEKYNTYMLDKLKEGHTPEEFEAIKTQYLADAAMWDSLLIQFFVMFLTVFVIGLIIALLSSMYFQLKPARS